MTKNTIAALVGSICAMFLCAPHSFGQSLTGTSLNVSGTATIGTLASGTATINVLTSGTANVNTLGVTGMATLQGGLSVSGSADLLGNSFLFGSWLSDPAVPGVIMTYTDATSSPTVTPSLFKWTATQPSHGWLWEHNTADQTSTVSMMRLDASHVLTIYNTSGNPSVVLDPNGAVTISGSAIIGKNLTISGTGSLTLPDGTVLTSTNTLKSVITSGTGPTSVLTQQAADSRYIVNGGTSTATLPSTTITGTETINGGLTVSGTATMNGSNLLTQATANSLYLTQAAADARYPINTGTVGGLALWGGTATYYGAVSIGGTSNTASGAYAAAIGGQANTASGASSASIGGMQNRASGWASTAMGKQTQANGGCSVAMGMASLANGAYSLAVGNCSYANGDSSVAMGTGYTTAGATNSICAGNGACASGSSSFSFGVGTSSSGVAAISLGGYAVAQGDYSLALGYTTVAKSYIQTVIGRYNIWQGNGTSWVPTDDLFTIGNGTSLQSPSDAFVVKKNGDTNVFGKLTVSASNCSTAGTPNGLNIIYNDGVSGTNASITQSATRPSAAWNWQRMTTSGSTANVMQIDASNRLILTGTAATNPPQLVLDPNGTVAMSGSAIIGANLTISGTGSLTLPDGTVLTSTNTLKGVLTSGTALTISGTIPASQVTGLSAVATSGNYNALAGLPTIPTNTNQLANGAGYITASGTAAFAQASATAAALSGTIQASQVAGIAPVATGGNLDYSKLTNAPTNVSAFANDAGYVASSGTGNNLTLSGTTKVSGGIVVTGTMDSATNTVVASGTNQLVLIPQQGDLSMGQFNAGATPQ